MNRSPLQTHSLAHNAHPRRGGVLIAAAFLLVMIFMFAALVVDFGYLSLACDQAQACADASAHAAAADLYPSPLPQTAIKLPIQLPIYKPMIQRQDVSPSIISARSLAASNRLAHTIQPTLLDSDIQFAVWDDGVVVGPPSTIGLVDGLLDALNLRTTDSTFVNSVQVTVRSNDAINGSPRLFFAPIFGAKQRGISESAQAAVARGYGVAAGDMLLPFAMDITVWNAIRFTNGEVNAVDLKPLGINLDNVTVTGLVGQNPLLSVVNQASPYDLLGNPICVLDNFAWKRPMTSVTPGQDKVWEVVLLADQLQSLKLPGLLGQVVTQVKHVPATFVSLDYRGGNSNTPDADYLNRVLVNGVDLRDIEGTSTTGDRRIWLPHSVPGCFEIPTACESNLKAMIGHPRIMPLYATLPGTVVNKVTDLLGMSHRFRIVGWGAVVITKVNLTGPIRYINVEPAIYTSSTVCPARGTRSSLKNSVLSDGVYTTPHLVR